MDDEDDDVPTCPLCLEELDATDRAVKACQCGYQVCLWCLHTIREQLNRRCPACRTPYEEQNFKFDDVNPQQAAKEARERQTAKRERERREKLKEIERERARAIVLSQQKAKSNLKHARILQRNLVYIIGLSLTLAREEVLRRADMFGKFGRMIRVLVNRSHPFNADAPGGPSISAYVQYQRDADALAAVRAMNNGVFDGREIRCAIATTKYCDTLVVNVQGGENSAVYHYCSNAHCLYYHTTAHSDIVLTKEEVLARQLGPPPPSHLFLPVVPRRPPYSLPHRSVHPNSSQQLTGPPGRGHPNRSVMSIPPSTSSQPLSNAPVIHPPSGPASTSQSFAPYSPAVPVPGTTSAQSTSAATSVVGSPPLTSPVRATAANAAIASHRTPPTSPLVVKRHAPRGHRSPMRSETARGSPSSSLSTSAPTASAMPLPSSSTWASTQPGHPVTRSPVRRKTTPSPPPPQPLSTATSTGAGKEPTSSRPVPVPKSLRTLDGPPGFKDSPPSKASLTPSRPPGFDVPLGRMRGDGDKTPVASSPDTSRAGALKHSTEPANSLVVPPGFEHPVSSTGDHVDEAQQKEAAAWLQEASTDEVFSVNEKRTVSPVGGVGSTRDQDGPVLAPFSSRDNSRAGLEKVLASLGGSLGVSSEFQTLSLPSSGVVDRIGTRETVSVAEPVSPIANHSVTGPAHSVAMSPTPDPSEALSNMDLRSSPVLSLNAGVDGVDSSEAFRTARAVAGRRNFSRFMFARESGAEAWSGRGQITESRSFSTMGTVLNSGVRVTRSDTFDNGPGVVRAEADASLMNTFSKMVHTKKQAAGRQTRSRFDFADQGRSSPGNGNVHMSSSDRGGSAHLMGRENVSHGASVAANVRGSIPLSVGPVGANMRDVLRRPLPVVAEQSLTSMFTSSDWVSHGGVPAEAMQKMTEDTNSGAVSTGLNAAGSGMNFVPNSHVGVTTYVNNGGENGAFLGRSQNVEGRSVQVESMALPPPGFREATSGTTPKTTAGDNMSSSTGVASNVVTGGKERSVATACGMGSSADVPSTAKATDDVVVGAGDSRNDLKGCGGVLSSIRDNGKDVQVCDTDATLSSPSVDSNMRQNGVGKGRGVVEEVNVSESDSVEEERKRSRAQRKRERKSRQTKGTNERKVGKVEERSAASLGCGVVSRDGNGHGDDSSMVGAKKETTTEDGSKEAEVGKAGETNGQAGASAVNVESSSGEKEENDDVDVEGGEVDSQGAAKAGEDVGKYMSVLELEREVEAARAREAQLQDKLMEITRRLRSYDNVRT